jgi:hypothetical protein
MIGGFLLLVASYEARSAVIITICVIVLTDCRLEYHNSVSGRGRNFCLDHLFQTNPGTNSAFSPMGTRSSLPEGKAAVA